MLSFGTNIQAQGDVLQKVTIDYLYHSLRSPKPSIEYQILQLRIIRDLDQRRYAILKKQLPYIVCGIFNPPVRRTESFAYTEYFILDIDHILDHDKDPRQVKRRIQDDTRVLLCFTSPGEDGLKVLFKLKEKCWDTGLYSLFYKTFAMRFASLYHLEDIIDFRTSDVCRACFISVDYETYYNPAAETVDINQFIDTSDVASMIERKKEFEKKEKEIKKLDSEEKTTSDPGDDVMKRIRDLLQGRQPKTKPEIVVPEELDTIMEGIRTLFESNGLTLVEITNIQYGKNLKLRLGAKKAELNLFFGKKGFTVVICPRTGTDAQLNKLCSDLVQDFIYSNT